MTITRTYKVEVSTMSPYVNTDDLDESLRAAVDHLSADIDPDGRFALSIDADLISPQLDLITDHVIVAHRYEPDDFDGWS
jgi:hypothetical protein